jgi:hypothetical protein
MWLDLMQLQSMHPLLSAFTAAEFAHRAGLGLERHLHVPGVALDVLDEGVAYEARLHWAGSPFGDLELHDRHRITEDAAEAIALALVHVARGWVVMRRMQRGEPGDWLLQDRESFLVALEVSGIDAGDMTDRLRSKLEQVRPATIAEQRVACVVELSTPRAKVVTAPV